MKYIVNGTAMSPEAFSAYKPQQKQAMLRDMLTTRTPPGGHEPYWKSGFESISSGVPEHQVHERREYLNERGIVGSEITDDGRAVANSPGSREKYLQALGMGDYSPAGTDRKALGKRKARSTTYGNRNRHGKH